MSHWSTDSVSVSYTHLDVYKRQAWVTMAPVDRDTFRSGERPPANTTIFIFTPRQREMGFPVSYALTLNYTTHFYFAQLPFHNPCMKSRLVSVFS